MTHRVLATGPNKKPEQFRDYERAARACVRELYRLNHQNQTLEFVLRKKTEYARLDHGKMGVWEALERLDALVDDSDPDTDLTQIEHALQTAEAIRAAGKPRWFVLTGLIHDLGKMLCIFGEPQWAVVGDTFPVGCAFSGKVVYPELFAHNPNASDARYRTELGIYKRGCGLRNVHLSWGHDEYLYRVMKNRLPEESLAIIRYHSFYAAHREGAYDFLMDDHDRALFRWVRAFSPFDLYSKSAERPALVSLRSFYTELIGEFLPATLDW